MLFGCLAVWLFGCLAVWHAQLETSPNPKEHAVWLFGMLSWRRVQTLKPQKASAAYFTQYLSS
jgi:hypothetical protein